MKIFKSFSAYLTNYLVHQGYEVLGTEPNKKQPIYDVYIFEDTSELRKTYADFCEMKRQKFGD